MVDERRLLLGVVEGCRRHGTQLLVGAAAEAASAASAARRATRASYLSLRRKVRAVSSLGGGGWIGIAEGPRGVKYVNDSARAAGMYYRRRQDQYAVEIVLKKRNLPVWWTAATELSPRSRWAPLPSH